MLLDDAAVLVTMDGGRREIERGWLYSRDGWIEHVGGPSDPRPPADERVDCSDLVLIPGLVNTHHHFYQTLTRTRAQQSELFDWLVELYPVWSRMTPDHIRVSTITALAELALSGCTTAFDHHYLWPAGTSVDHQVEAAAEVGLRVHVSRGSMSVGESSGGLPPDSVVEDEDYILTETERAIDAHHEYSPGAMTRIVVAPCSPFSVSRGLMRASADLARSKKVTLHTHLAETRDEESYCLDTFGLRPVDLAESVGWLGDDVWFAHGVHLSGDDIKVLAHSGTGVAHCPTSNMRLASGSAPLSDMLGSGVSVGLGVDGSASNDGSNLLAEARQALLVSRLSRAISGSQRPLIGARATLELATLGGARVLGRDDIGSLEPGKVADIAGFRVDDVALAGAVDPVAGLVLSGPFRAAEVWVHGRRIVEDGRLATLDLGRHLSEHRRLARMLND